MKKRIKIILALAASIAAIAVGQRYQSDQKQKDARTQRAEVEGIDQESLFI